MNTCIHCDAKLGQNLLLPEFPVGRKLAFDPVDARLWAVCPKCQRWNLSWLDDSERRAAVARLDQYFAATPSKTSTSGIGIAEVGKTQLIRIGAAPWAAFASWRYGRRLIGRWRQWLFGAFVTLPFVIWLWTQPGKQFFDQNNLTFALILFIVLLYAWHTVMRMALPNGATGKVRAEFAQSSAVMVSESGWSLFVEHEKGVAEVHGKEALRALALMLPFINHRGATRKQVDQAIATIEAHGGPERFVSETLSPRRLSAGLHQLKSLANVVRVALEIAVNEEAEKAALRGDLASIAIQRDTALKVAKAAELV